MSRNAALAVPTVRAPARWQDYIALNLERTRVLSQIPAAHITQKQEPLAQCKK